MSKLDNKVALITGGTSGIGAATAIRFHQAVEAEEGCLGRWVRRFRKSPPLTPARRSQLAARPGRPRRVRSGERPEGHIEGHGFGCFVLGVDDRTGDRPPLVRLWQWTTEPTEPPLRAPREGEDLIGERRPIVTKIDGLLATLGVKE